MAREISLECLPRRNGTNIDWSKSVNYSINFNLCHEFAISSVVKQVCDLYESGITIKDLAQRFKLNLTTIRDYLHQGYKINWCSYNPKRKGVN